VTSWFEKVFYSNIVIELNEILIKVPETWQVLEKIIIFNFMILGQAEEVARLQASPDQPLPQEGLPQSR
jgi:hypothetical protein